MWSPSPSAPTLFKHQCFMLKTFILSPEATGQVRKTNLRSGGSRKRNKRVPSNRETRLLLKAIQKVAAVWSPYSITSSPPPSTRRLSPPLKQKHASQEGHACQPTCGVAAHENGTKGCPAIGKHDFCSKRSRKWPLCGHHIQSPHPPPVHKTTKPPSQTKTCVTRRTRMPSLFTCRHYEQSGHDLRVTCFLAKALK